MGISSNIDPEEEVIGEHLRERFFKLEGMNIDGIRYTIFQISEEQYGGMTDDWKAACEYWVERDIGREKKNLNNLEARVKKREKGLFKKEMVDFSWVGGRIADVLNQDTSLREPLLGELLTARTTGSDADIWITPKEKGAWITGCATNGHKNKKIPLLLPSKDAFRAYDRIAKHIRDYTIL